VGSDIDSDPDVEIMSGPSLTGQAVAVARAGLKRPQTANGDPDAQRRLCVGMRGGAGARWLRSSLAARTKFFDDELLKAISRGVSQIVIVGAGYDDRPLRFRAPGVDFVEIDHPSTQADKARRLDSMDADLGSLHLAQADFRHDDIADVLTSSGHDPNSPSHFMCEGVLVYLDEAIARRLLSVLASCATAESTLAVSLATHRAGVDSRTVVAEANAARRTGRTEPWRTILPVDTHLALISETGWQVDRAVDAAQLVPGAESGRSVFVAAQLRPTSAPPQTLEQPNQEPEPRPVARR
jgi:methyltransferase (TIGR00027 family)